MTVVVVSDGGDRGGDRNDISNCNDSDYFVGEIFVMLLYDTLMRQSNCYCSLFCASFVLHLFCFRRNFISAGAAAGVASAFGAPVGGLLFSMEEVSSFWNLRLSWNIFCCAMVATFTTALFNSAFSGFQYQGSFGAFKSEEYILFKVLNLSINSKATN